MVYIVGYGAMAKAMIEGFLAQGIECAVVGRDATKRKAITKEYGIATYPLHNFDITEKDILLAVKPYALLDVAKELEGEANICYSVLASTPIAALQEAIEAKHYVRAMPNIAASKQASMTTLTGDEEVKEEALKLFMAIGEVLWLESETKLDIATAIAGSGPAFLALVAEALADGGVACGLKRDEAYKITAGLFKSYATLADNIPCWVKDQVMSPAGTTAAGYGVLEERAVRSAFIAAVKKAFER